MEIKKNDHLVLQDLFTYSCFKNVSTNPSVQKIHDSSEFERRALCLVQQLRLLCHVIQFVSQIKKLLNKVMIS